MHSFLGCVLGILLDGREIKRKKQKCGGKEKGQLLTGYVRTNQGLATDPVDFDEYWEGLSQSLREIHAKNASRLSFEELYRNAYKLVLKKHGEKLYRNVEQLVVEHLKVVAIRDVRPLVPSAVVIGGASFGTASVEKRIGGTNFLDRLKVVWEDHQLCLGMMKDVLMYMVGVFLLWVLLEHRGKEAGLLMGE